MFIIIMGVVFYVVIKDDYYDGYLIFVNVGVVNNVWVIYMDFVCYFEFCKFNLDCYENDFQFFGDVVVNFDYIKCDQFIFGVGCCICFGIYVVECSLFFGIFCIFWVFDIKFYVDVQGNIIFFDQEKFMQGFVCQFEEFKCIIIFCFEVCKQIVINEWKQVQDECIDFVIKQWKVNFFGFVRFCKVQSFGCV